MAKNQQLTNLPPNEMEATLNQLLRAMTIVAQGDTSYRLNLPADTTWGKTFNARFEEMTQALQNTGQSSLESQAIISAITEQVFQSLDYDSIVTNATKAIVENTPVSGIAIYHLDQASQSLKRVAAHGFSKEALKKGATLSLEKSVTGLAISRKEIITLEQLADDDRLDTDVKAALIEQGLKGVAVVPLFLQNDALGAMNLVFETGYQFSESDKKTLSSIGKTIALAMVNAQYLSVIETEVSERIEVEQRIQASLERRTQQVETSTQVAQEIASATALNKLFQRIVDLIQKQFGYYQVNLYILQDENLILQAGTGTVGKKLIDEAHQIALPQPGSPVAQAVQRGEPVSIVDVNRQTGWLPNPHLPKTRSQLTAPIKLQNQTLGVLDIHADKPNALGSEDQLLLMGLCGQIAVAIQSHRADEALRLQTTLLKTQNEAALDGIILVSKERKILTYNQRFVEMWDIPQAVMESGSSHEAVASIVGSVEDGEAFAKKTDEIYALTDQTSYDEISLKDGRVFERYSTPITTEESGYFGRVWYFRDITERKEAELALRASEERYRTILEEIADGYYELDLSGKFTFFNPKLPEIFAYPAEELMGMGYQDYATEQTAGQMFDEFNQLFKTGQPFSGKHWVVLTKEGSLRHIEASGTLMYDDSDQATGFRGIVRDVTERRQAEQALQESEALYRTILENIEDGYYEVDLSGTITFFNDALINILEWPKAEIMGLNYKQYVSPETGQRVYEAFNNVFTTGEPLGSFPYEILTKDGRSKFVETSVTLRKDKDGKVLGFRGIFRDVTERQRVEAQIQASQQFLRNIMDALPSPIFVKDEEFRWVELNNAFADIMGYPRETILGKTDYDFFPEEEAELFREVDATIFATGEQNTSEEAFTDGSGETRTIVTSKSVFENLDGERILVGAITDVTAIRQAQAEAHQRAEEQAILNELGQALTSRLDVIEVLQEAHKQTARLVDATNFYIGIYESEKNEITFRLQVSESQVDQSITTIKGDEGLAGYMVQNRTGLFFKDNVAEGVRALGMDMIGEEALCWLGVPMMLGDLVLGVIAVQSYSTPYLYDEHDQELLTAVANQVAIALQNAMQFERSQKQIQREQTIREITEKMRATTNVNDLVKTTAEELGKRLSAGHVVVDLGLETNGRG